MGLFEKGPPPASKRILRIERDVLRMVFESSRATHPNEFAATLRAEGDTIVELVLVPASIGAPRSATLPLFNLPHDVNIVGTVHSHPGPSALPSDADLNLFSHFGRAHIIVHEPYDDRTWRAYDHDGRPMRLEVVG